MSTRSEQLLGSKSKVDANEPSGPSGWRLSQFLFHEATRSISTTPGWDVSPSQDYPQY